MTAWPSSRSAWMRASSAFVSLSDSAVVGSSKIEHARRLAEHLGDLDELADGQRQRADLGRRVEPVEADALEHRARLPAQLAGRVIPREAAGAHEQVLRRPTGRAAG
jgi:hypothetical protein